MIGSFNLSVCVLALTSGPPLTAYRASGFTCDADSCNCSINVYGDEGLELAIDHIFSRGGTCSLVISYFANIFLEDDKFLFVDSTCTIGCKFQFADSIGTAAETFSMAGGSLTREDLVDVLQRIKNHGQHGIPFTNDNIKAVILDMFAAGTEPSLSMVTLAMSELMKNPKTMEKAKTEVRQVLEGKTQISGSDLTELHYMKLVIKETPRLHPPAPLLVPRGLQGCIPQLPCWFQESASTHAKWTNTQYLLEPELL